MRKKSETFVAAEATAEVAIVGEMLIFLPQELWRLFSNVAL